MAHANVVTDYLYQLESNDTQVVEEVKQKFYEQFNIVQDSWLLYGLYDYYMASNSIRSLEILLNIREPHHAFLFNKLLDTIRGNTKTESKVQALTLLGHVLRKEPPWLYKITEHQLLRDLLKLLKTETDILLLLSALLVLVILLPIVPSRMGNFLQDVFDIFSRLAAWNCSNPEKLVEEQMVHMQLALYALFQRLYGMYPCNFLAYLRNQYRSKEQIPIFVHTVKPMLDTVKMHPLLVTASKDKETTTERWKKMGSHDVVVECERFTLDVGDKCPHESGYLTSSFRSRSGTTNSTTFDSSQQLQCVKNTSRTSLALEAKEFYTPGTKLYCQTPPVPDSLTTTPITHLQGPSAVGTSQEGTSPPEAAIEATPETTPIKDVRLTSRSQLPTGSAVRALSTLSGRNWSIGSSSSTPSHSQPSSPMRKESSPFSFAPTENRISAFGLPKRDQPYAAQKLQRLIQDRTQVIEGGPLESRSRTPVLHPTSPLRIIPTCETSNSHSPVQRIESPVSQEDEEVLEIVRQGELEQRPNLRQCDSVLQESESRGIEEDLDECEQEHGSPCTAGGLHMPNSRSMNDFAKRIRRLRYHSQCGGESELPEISTGSSPGNCAPFSSNTVRRANSCPEMKKIPVVPTKDNRNKTLEEADEEMNREIIHGGDGINMQTQKLLLSTETQTEGIYLVMPYELMFLGMFPSMESGDGKPSPAPSPLNVQDKFLTASPYEILDKYIDIAVRSEKDGTKHLKEQLQLLHQWFLFERHRREAHAVKNRRLLADAKNTKALEEHNSALRDQVQLQQKDIDHLKDELEAIKRDKYTKGRQECESIHHWENKYISAHQDYVNLKQQTEEMHREYENLKSRIAELDNKRQRVESALFEANAEVKIAKEQAWAGEKGKAELEHVNKELLISGEMQQRYQEKLIQLPYLKRSEEELARFTESYSLELKSLRQQLDSKSVVLETFKSRIAELEQAIIQCEERCNVQKRVLNETKEAYDVKLKAVESKYQSQLTITRSLQEKILELRQESGRPTPHSPDTSSCHEVIPTLTDRTSIATGLSAHSSPLSASLASSESSAAAFGHSDGRNLQYMMDQKEPVPSTSKTTATEEETLNESSTSNLSQSSSPFSANKQD